MLVESWVVLATYVREVKEDYQDILLSSQNFSEAAWWAKIRLSQSSKEGVVSRVKALERLAANHLLAFAALKNLACWINAKTRLLEAMIMPVLPTVMRVASSFKVISRR